MLLPCFLFKRVPRAKLLFGHTGRFCLSGNEVPAHISALVSVVVHVLPCTSERVLAHTPTYPHVLTVTQAGTAPVRWSKECEEVDVDVGDDVDVEADADVQEGVEYESAGEMEVNVVEYVCTGSDLSVDTYAHAHAHAYPTNVQLNVYLHVHTLCRC